MPISKPFAIATEGATTDGRVITAEWIKQMAETYDPKAYTALGNLEHYMSMMPDSVFGAYGKVVSLSTRFADILGEKKLQLMCVFDASDALVALQKAGQKMFASMEVNPNFAKTSKAYLEGLGFTNKPASLGTEIMQFAAQAKENPFAGRKRNPENLFTVAEEVTLEWETEKSSGDTLFSKVKDLLGMGKKETDANFADISKAIEAIAQSQKEILDRFSGEVLDKFSVSERDIKTLREEQAKFAADFAALKETLGKTDGDDKNRGTATGGDGTITTDC
ncbi:MAG: capsid protein [Betaproteobacteria bacterium HGW-Betaproteobacteria-4]|jgi:hypothetical protein|nr:MAG: capsid protein [Betaproteobacteria bacterium HGW-Betaproteobacteria-4]